MWSLISAIGVFPFLWSLSVLLDSSFFGHSLQTKSRWRAVVCFLKASWISKIFLHYGMARRRLSLGTCKPCVPTFFPQSQKSFHKRSQEVPPPSRHLLWRELAHDIGYSCSCYWRILYSSSCYRRTLRYRRILLVVSTGAYYPLVATTGGFLLQEDPS